MNVLFCIFTHSHGKGGHYYSFRTISSQFVGQNFKTMEIGWNKSPILDLDTFIYYNPFFYFFKIIEIYKYLLVNKIKVVHCFDEHSYLLMRIPCFLLKIKLIITRCGGANPTRYFPDIDNIICFSLENFQYFNNLDKPLVSEVIPNRCKIESNYEFNNSCNNKILSIARIGMNYKEKHKKAISLVKYLLSQRINAKLSIIGVVEDDEVLRELKDLSSGLPVKFITCENYTKNASRLIPGYDYVVGTGRGAMEAMGYGKPVLAVNYSNELPFFVTKNNLSECLNFNFSLRIPSQDKTVSQMLSVFSSIDEYQELMKFSIATYKEHFDVLKVIIKYKEFYQKATVAKSIKFSDFVKNYFHNMYYYYLFIKNKYL